MPQESWVSSDETFSLDYYADGGSTPTIGVGGGAPVTATDENTLSADVRGAGLAEIYAPNDQYSWPTSIACGYRGIQAYPIGGQYYSSNCDANGAWLTYTGT